MFMRTNGPWWLPGAALVIFGLAIVIFPELLSLMVASAFVIAGMSWLFIASKARKFTQKRAPTMYVYRDQRDYTTY